ncbi:hypothetical protein SARC_02288 [Sphaeroforma arctica JP610]|uniref:Symplekin C-terminal domain-containing protein n=1 Tax=Sphaeroforma arctica JP610 TaxID=667725 RepID=A0A0L0G923_9EUKA|nr:hypothetical protein SARC_02288 [Sphaeroforma arctica JP610]KNC85527.1 hypothetical protein SARC_02288 [Sphaeroforma arctica JP610]|eukprot:XP_014159429.1 hypothetical protein SARC_02288 [Sphaeroforma arctica JP610]
MEEALPDTLEVLEYRLHDDAPQVVKRAITCNATLHQMVFSWMCRVSMEKAEASRDLWDQLVAMKDIICERLTTTDNIGFKSTAVKFVEVIVLLYSRKNADSENKHKHQTPSVDRIPERHTVLEADELTQEAGHLVELLMSTFQTEPNTGYLVVVVAVLGSIARQRPEQHFAYIVNGLCDQADALATKPHITESQRESLAKALKTQLMGLLRHPTAAVNAEAPERMARVLVNKLSTKKNDVERLYRQTMAENLRMTTTTDNASIFDPNTTVNQNVPSASDPRVSQSERGVKRDYSDTGVTANEGHAIADSRHVKKPKISQVIDQGIQKKKVLSERELLLARLLDEIPLAEAKLTSLTLPMALEPGMLRELVLLTLPKLPAQAPPDFTFEPDELEKNCKLIISTANDAKDPRKAATIVFPPALIALLRPDSTSTITATDKSDISGNSDKLDKLETAEKVEKVAPPKIEAAAATLTPKPSASKTGSAAAGTRKKKFEPPVLKAKPAVRKGPFVLKPLPLDAPQRLALALQAFTRILHNEEPLLSTGQCHKRVALIVKMASMTMRLSAPPAQVKGEASEVQETDVAPENDPFANALLQFILADFKRGFELLLIWLYQEYRNAELFAVYGIPVAMDIDQSDDTNIKIEPESPQKTQRYGYKRFDYFLMQAVLACKDILTPKDRMFTRLILESPRITPGVLEVVRDYCHSEEYSALGVATVRDLIVHRVPDRIPALRLLLECTNSPDAAMSRTNAIINIKKIYSTIPSVRDHIESFAIENFRQLLPEHPSKAIYVAPAPEQPNDAEAEDSQNPQKETTSETDPSVHPSEKEKNRSSSKPSSDTGADSAMQVDTVKTEPEDSLVNDDQVLEWNDASIELCCLLYYALCVTNTSLLGGVFALYCQCSNKKVQAGIRRNIDTLVRHIGADNEDLQAVIRDYPEGADHLVLKALNIVTQASRKDGTLPIALVEIAREKFQSTNNIHFLIQVLAGLNRDDIVTNLGAMLGINEAVTKDVLDRLLAPYGSGGSGNGSITPADLLIAIHELRPANKQKQKNIIFAHRYCFEKKDVLSPEVLGVAIQQMVDTVPLSPMLMLTVIKSVEAYPKMQDFVLSILTRLISKSIWNTGSLWKGWIKCCTSQQMQPQSYSVLLQLPYRQLKEILEQQTNLGDELVKYVKGLPILQQNQVPRDIRRTLGIKL